MSELNIPADFFEQTIEVFMYQSMFIDAIEAASPEAKKSLNAFMFSMQEYIKTGKSHWNIRENQALCSNFERYVAMDSLPLRTETKILFMNVLKSRFGANDLPFNTCWSDYRSESYHQTFYLNPKRLSFIENWKPL